MNQPADLVAEVRAYCADNADPKLATKWARYFTEGYEAWGLLDSKHAFWNQKQDEWLLRYSKLGLRGFLKAGALLFESGKYEEGALAIRFIRTFRDEFDAKTLSSLGAWFRNIQNWAHTDVLCSELIAPLIASGTINLDTLAPWRESKYKFQRRAVPVAMLGLLKKPHDSKQLLDFVRPLMMDDERVVQQGMGWFLRESWKKCPAPVEAFLLEWKDIAPRLIYQYATEKMDKSARLRFRRAKA